MASQNWRKDRGALEQGLVDLFARITFGASGAPTLDVAGSKGIASITKSSTGDYIFKLSDSYLKLLGVRHTFDTSGASGAAPAAPGMFVKAQSPAISGGGTIEVVFNAAGTAANPASGEAVLVQIILKNSIT